MLKIQGKLLTTIESAIYKNKEGFPSTSKPKLQMLVKRKDRKGNLIHELHTITVPEKIFEEMKNKLNQNIEIDSDYYISKDKVYFVGI